MENLITQGLKALDSSPYQAEWQQLLDRLEVLILNAPPNPKLVNEANSGDSVLPMDAVTEDNVPTRCVVVSRASNFGKFLTNSISNTEF